MFPAFGHKRRDAWLLREDTTLGLSVGRTTAFLPDTLLLAGNETAPLKAAGNYAAHPSWCFAAARSCSTQRADNAAADMVETPWLSA